MSLSFQMSPIFDPPRATNRQQSATPRSMLVVGQSTASSQLDDDRLGTYGVRFQTSQRLSRNH